jgi:hypothetical protein
MKARALLTALGLPVSLVGAGGCLWIIREILRERAGECDFVACTSASTAPAFRLALGGLITGLVMLGLAASTMKTRARLAALGFPLSLFGAWASLPLLREILEHRYYDVTATTVTLFVVAIGGLIAGLVMLGLAFKRGGVTHGFPGFLGILRP